MTAASASSRPPRQACGCRWRSRIALRELRAGAGGLTVFVLCIALGVAAVAAIGSLAALFDQALARQGRLLIGGDLSFELVTRQANAEERAALDALGQVSEFGELPRHGPHRLRQERAGRGQGRRRCLSALWRGRGARAGGYNAGAAWRFPGVVRVERDLLDRLGVDIGSQLSIGEASVIIGGVLGAQPDRLADRLAYGPELLMSRETLARTGLVQPGSLSCLILSR